MARCDNTDKLPSKIYFLKTYNAFNGPYTKKPTLLKEKKGGELIEFLYDEESGNYIQIQPPIL